MSISPTRANRSVSVRDLEDNRSSGDGFLPKNDRDRYDTRTDGASPLPFGSARDFISSPPLGGAVNTSGTAGMLEVTFSPSKSVRETKGSTSLKNSNVRRGGIQPQHQPSVHGGSSYRFTLNACGPQPGSGIATVSSMPGSDHWSLVSNGLNVPATQAGPRRSQAMNANHLLNFHYGSIPRSFPQQKLPPPRRQHKIKLYNKDLFLQANYKFVIYDSGNYIIEAIDPDKMFPWEDVVCMKYSTPLPVQCPICLESPLCPQITSCGHIYCYACILRYLDMGKEDYEGESWKKCPMCFALISSKDLYTVQLERVQLFHVGDHAEFALLSRSKDSTTPLLHCHDSADSSCSGASNLFSKYILTSDVELSVRDAKAALLDWLNKAEAGVVDDLEKLPYVCAALEQLDERMKIWKERLVFSGSPTHDNLLSCSPKVMNKPYSSKSHSFHSTFVMKHDRMVRSLEIESKHMKPDVPGSSSDKLHSDMPSGSSELRHDLREHLGSDSNSCKDSGVQDTYAFYQAIDGQPLILHPLNMRCLLHHFGNHDMLPPRISGQILELVTVTQSEAMRKRYRHLSHFPLTTTFQFCEIDLSETLPHAALAPFMEEIMKREKQRKQLAKKERHEKAKAEAADRAEVASLREMLNPTNQRYLTNEDTIFLLDEFEALGTGAPTLASSSMNCDAKLFSNVTRLGFAAGHDSPMLRAEVSANLSRKVDSTQEPSCSQGSRPIDMLSFASVLSTKKSAGVPEKQHSNGTSKKGKKPSRVLLSTAGGRRY
ncbi:hypothetical protein HPP92_024403 [Vanilla planifolia]|uniref:RING-type domain-containing protein n=1 Tax=Vanilla planifolia TaxID=51239 RepID=A0A835UD86_VANPL|nr:hypothetical protein HPP92_024403 [Vanilla planifolia]